MKRPNALIYVVLGFLVKVFAYFKGQRVIEKVRIHQPAVVLSNHTSFYDFIYTTAALYPKRVSYLAANKMFYDPVLGPFLRLARAIPKSLFQPDPVATLKAFKILKKGGLVSIFPEGQISPYGKSLTPAFSIAKFLRKAKVDVYTVIHHNAYFVNPPWSKKTFKGPIETKMALIITKEVLSTLTDQEIYDIVVKKTYFNASAYNEEKKHIYKLNDIKNLENVIYLCPKCQYEGLVAKKDHLHCPSCSLDLSYDKYGHIGGYRIDELFSAQEKQVQERILNHPDFVLSNHVKLESFRNKRVVEVGYGKLSLDPMKYHFDGVVDGLPSHLTFDVKNVSTLPSDIGRNIQIYEENQLYQFVFEDPKLPTMYVHAGEFIYQQYHKNRIVIDQN